MLNGGMDQAFEVQICCIRASTYGRFRPIQGDSGRFRAIQGDSGFLPVIGGVPIQGDSGRFRAIQGDSGRFRTNLDFDLMKKRTFHQQPGHMKFVLFGFSASAMSISWGAWGAWGRGMRTGEGIGMEPKVGKGIGGT